MIIFMKISLKNRYKPTITCKSTSKKQIVGFWRLCYCFFMEKNKKNKNLLKAAIITMSLVQMGTNGIAPILSDIAAAFPQCSTTTIQFLMTFPSIFCLIFTMLSAFLSDKLPKKTLGVTGLSIICLTGVAACLFHNSIVILYVWAAFLGIGIGMVAPLAPALVNECFTGKEKQTMLGWQNSANNIGSMIMTFASGFLAMLGWNFGYLVYLLGAFGIIFALLGVPGKSKADSNRISEEKQAVSAANRGKFRLVILKEMIVTCLFLFIYSAAPANLSMLVTERGLGDASFAGTVSTMFLLGGMITGLLFGVISSIMKNWTAMCGSLVLAVGAVIIAISQGTVSLIIGCLVAGASISMILPVCMGSASRLKGYETLNSAMILSSSFVGVFLAPLITNIGAFISGSNSTMFRFFTIAGIAVILSIITKIFGLGKELRT